MPTTLKRFLTGICSLLLATTVPLTLPAQAQEDEWGDSIPFVPQVSRGHDGTVMAFDFSKDDKLLVTGALDGIRVWDLATKTPIRSFQSEDGSVLALKLLRDGHSLLAAYDKGSLVRWDLDTGQKNRLVTPKSYMFHSGRWKKSIITVDERWIWSEIGSSYIEVYSAVTGKRQWTVDLREYITKQNFPGVPLDEITHANNNWYFQIDRMVASPDGRWLSVGASVRATNYGQAQSQPAKFPGAVFLWDLQRQKLVHAGRQDQERQILAFSPDNQRVLAYPSPQNGAGGLQLQDRRKGNVQQSLGDLSAREVTFSSDGKYMAGIGWSEGILWLWDVQAKKAVPIPHSAYTSALEFSKSSGLLAASGDEGDFALFDSRSGQLVHQFSRYRGPDEARAVSSDGKRIVTSKGGRLYIWNLETASLERTIVTFEEHRSGYPIISQDARSAIALEELDNKASKWQLRICDLNTGLTRTLPLALPITNDTVIWGSLVFSPDGNEIALGFTKLIPQSTPQTYRPTFTFVSILQKLSLHDGTVVWEKSVSDRRMGGIAFSYDGKSIASVHYTYDAPNWRHSLPKIGRGFGEVRIWNSATGELQQELARQAGEAGSVQFSPDGDAILTNSSSQVRIWDVHTGALLESLAGNWQSATIVDKHNFLTQSRPALGHNVPTSAYLEFPPTMFKSWGTTGREPWDSVEDEPFRLPYAFHNGKPALAGYSTGVQLLDNRRVTFMTIDPNRAGDATRWLIYTPDGYYTGSEDIETFMRWPSGGKFVSGDNFKTSRRRPEEVRRQLNTQSQNQSLN